MVRDYETPTVPRGWETFTQSWAEKLGLSRDAIVMSCSPDRYGIPVVLRIVTAAGEECISTRRGSDADDAPARRQRFLDAVRRRDVRSVELDVAGYFVGEGSIDCSLCSNGRPHEEWQHVIIRELLRVSQPPDDGDLTLLPDDADDAESLALDREVSELLSGA
jgi:hypothetical protein